MRDLIAIAAAVAVVLLILTGALVLTGANRYSIAVVAFGAGFMWRVVVAPKLF